MKSFSVLTVSRRNGWFDDAWLQVCHQTVYTKMDEWVIVQEGMKLPEGVGGHLRYMGSKPVNTIQAPKQTRVSNLNASLNEGLRRITTDYVIFYQDFIELPEDCFEKLLALATPTTFVTTCTPNYDGSDDGRFTGKGVPRECYAREWEANVAIAPMPIVRELGGFDEEYDNGWSWDNANLAERAEMLGCKFTVDESNRPKLYPHEVNNNELIKPNGDLHAQTMEAIRKGDKPLRLDYLRVGNGTYRG